VTSVGRLFVVGVSVRLGLESTRIGTPYNFGRNREYASGSIIIEGGVDFLRFSHNNATPIPNPSIPIPENLRTRQQHTSQFPTMTHESREMTQATGRFRWPILAGGASGLLVAFVAMLYYAATTQAAPKERRDEEKGHEPEIAMVAEEPTALRDRIVTALLSGNYAKGLKLIREWDTETTDALYLKGLCHEGLRQWSEARTVHREAFTISEGDSRLAVGLALARCAIALGKRNEAESELWVVAHDATSRQIHTECLYHVALLAERFAEPLPLPNPFDAQAVAWPEFRIAPETAFQRLRVESKRVKTKTSSPNQTSTETTHTQAAMENRLEHRVKPLLRSQLDDAMRQAWEADPSHPSATESRLCLAASAQVAGRSSVAQREYQQIRKSTTSGNCLTVAAYNLGLLEHAEWRITTAREAFLDVVDRNPGTRWESLAWWWLGRMEVDLGNTSASQEAWRRAAVGGGREIESAVGIGRIAMSLWEDTQTAEELFLTLRPSRHSHHQEYAELFTAYFRYRNQPTENREKNLVEAIRSAGNGRSLGPMGIKIAGELYLKCRRPQLRLALFEETIPKIQGYWAEQLTLDVADSMREQGDIANARQRYLAVAKASREESGDRARIALAEVAIKANEARQAIQYCQELHDTSLIDQATVHRIMGMGYEMLGDHQKAAIYYGKIAVNKK
jgi:tetratricopeptide (TPR) repeat protein